ncbi:MAG: inorganic phosphate transporter [Thermoplasmata archaeon]
MISIIILIELLILTSIVSGNNMSIAIGPLVGSNTLKKDFSKLFGAFGFILGLYFGSKFMNVTFKSLFPQSNMYILLGISATILIFIIAQIARAPLSLTMVLTGIGFGYTFSKGIFSTLEIRIIIMWIIAPLSGFYLSYILMKFYNVLKIKNIWRGLKTIKMLIIIFSFFSSFTLGENTLGNKKIFHSFYKPALKLVPNLYKKIQNRITSSSKSLTYDNMDSIFTIY